MKRILGVLVLGLLLGVAVMCVRALCLSSRQVPAAPPSRAAEPVDAEGVAARLGGAIRFETLSVQGGGDAHAAAFRAFEDYLERTWPRLHDALRRERVPAPEGVGRSLLYTWKGRDPDAPALLLAAHHDVVPVEAGTEERWEEPPFSGRVAGGEVWGRGALDDKGSLVAILEAVESLLAEGFVPERSVLLAFGHDEELGGPQGATRIAATLAERGTPVAAVLDEGGVVADGMVDLVEGAVAVVGIAEKGSVSLALTLESEGGHSSTPPRHSGIGILARAVTRLEDHPMPARIDGTTRRFLEALAPELDFPARLALANLWITGGAIEALFAASPPLDAMIRTTTAATIFQGGVKSNVLPKQVRAVVNFRILPGDTVDDVVEHVRRTIDDPRIGVAPTSDSRPRNPSPVSPDTGPAWESLAGAIRAVHPDTLVVPYLVVGGTDARHYAGLTPNVYRFLPFRMGEEALKRVHGTDEHISVENLADGVRFYRTLIQTF